MKINVSLVPESLLLEKMSKTLTQLTFDDSSKIDPKETL